MGAGNNSISGELQPSVDAGLRYILSGARLVPAGLDLRADSEGDSAMYVQAIGTICLCEAAALADSTIKAAGKGTRRIGNKSRKQAVAEARELKQAAQAALRFIRNAQNRSGGWRYGPEVTDGDTSIVGWQVMALASGRSAGFPIPAQTQVGVRRFLMSMTPDGGATYGYDRPTTKASTTAVGLLSQMYLGWNRETPALARGVAYLSRRGPQRNDMYYNYYATQVMHHWGGEEWERWNEKMREQLIFTQVKSGHGAGSWNIADHHASHGGRLYMTCLATMTLEVYYRHLPLYDHIERIATTADSPGM